MESVTVKSKPQLRKKVSLHNNSLRAYDIPALIEKMKQSHSWANGELNTIVLLKSQRKHILLTAMHEETEVSSYQSNYSVTFKILEGQLMFHTQQKTVIINLDQVLTLNEKIGYRLIAMKDTVFMLTIFTGRMRPDRN